MLKFKHTTGRRLGLTDLGKASVQTKGPTPMVGLDSVSGQYWDRHATLAD